MHTGSGRRWCFGRTHIQPACSSVHKSGHTLAGEVGGEEPPTTLSVLISSHLQDSPLAQAKGLKLIRKEHHQNTWMLAGPYHKPLCCLPCASSPVPFNLLSETLSESLGPASMGGSGSSLLTDHDSGLFSGDYRLTPQLLWEWS